MLAIKLIIASKRIIRAEYEHFDENLQSLKSDFKLAVEW